MSKKSLGPIPAVYTAISIYYYLNLVRHSYIKEVPLRDPAVQSAPLFSNMWGLVLVALLILLGTVPGPVIDVAVAASSELMGR